MLFIELHHLFRLLLAIVFMLLLNLFHMWLQCGHRALRFNLLHKEWNQDDTNEHYKKNNRKCPLEGLVRVLA